MNHNRKTRIPVPAGAMNPLAKVMEKKPKSKSTKQPETWYDEEIESVSQRQQLQSKTEQEKRKEALYAQLRKTEEELVSMQDLLEKREKVIKEAEEESQKETESNDANNEPGEQSEKVEKITKKTMKNMRDRMQDMREKLQKMNRDTDCYLADIENTMQYLESLEVASDRLGPLSEETRVLFGDVDDEKIIAEIYKENKEPTAKGPEEMNGQDENRDSPEEKETPRDPSKFFLTERTTTSNPVQNPAVAADEDVDRIMDDA